MTNYQSFESIIDQYKVFFLDSYGVLRNHDGVIDGIANTLNLLESKGKTYRIITNDASRDQAALCEALHYYGLTMIKEKHIISSGMMARSYLENKVQDGLIAYLGTKKSANYILQSTKTPIPIGEVTPQLYSDIVALVFLDDEGFDWNTDINKAFNLLRYRNIPVIVANTDKIYPKSATEVNLAAGAIARLIETISGRTFIKFGKPDTQLFIHALETIKDYQLLSRKDIVMVGDTLHTDILGGNKFGIATALVLTGNTSAEEATLMIRTSSIIPDYVCASAGVKHTIVE